MSQPFALGFRVHSGWAALVAIGGSIGSPVVIERRRIELSDCLQPYHAAEGMPLAEAAEFVSRCKVNAIGMACRAIREIVTGTARACVLLGEGKPTGDLAKTLSSHVLIHAAEGELFRNVVIEACESCKVPVIGVKERQLWTRASTALGLSNDELESRLSEVGKKIGPPWRQDEKLCALAAWAALAYDGALTAESRRIT